MKDSHPSPLDGRHVRLLHRHWHWLEAQPRGVDASLRLLIEIASRDLDGQYRAARVKEACYLFMRDTAGDRPHFEEAVRALFANDTTELHRQMAPWPRPIREHVTGLLDSIQAGGTTQGGA